MTHGQSAAAAEAGERLLAEDAIRIEYVEARTEGPMAGYQPFTTDAEPCSIRRASTRSRRSQACVRTTVTFVLR